MIFEVSIGEFKKNCRILKNKLKSGDWRWNYVYPIPKNGSLVAYEMNLGLPIIYDPELIDDHTLVIDDIVDSGETIKKMKINLNQIAVLYNKSDLKIPYTVEHIKNMWIKFFWEKENDIDDCIIRSLEFAGMSPADSTVRFVRNMLEGMR